LAILQNSLGQTLVNELGQILIIGGAPTPAGSVRCTFGRMGGPQAAFAREADEVDATFTRQDEEVEAGFTRQADEVEASFTRQSDEIRCTFTRQTEEVRCTFTREDI
jgi:hypothetical protein